MAQAQGEAIIRFKNVSFEYGHNKPILKEVDFSVRQGAKMAIMGQNGAGKSTIFQLITGALKAESGDISKDLNLKIALARQAIPREQLDLTVLEFFQQCFSNKVYDIEPKIDTVLEVVNLRAPHDRLVRSFSGGQQARLLLASALIQDSDVLLLDEPTNNLDKDGIAHLRHFLIDYKKTCLVISHDAQFLNAFTHGVLYLDSFNQKIEQYTGNYFKVVAEITQRIERERRTAVRKAKEVEHRKEQVGFFAQKGGHMRDVAKKMREKIKLIEEEEIEERQEDKIIRPFVIPCQEDIAGDIVNLTKVSVMRGHKPITKKVAINLKRRDKLELKGPNGIGKTTLLEMLASGKAKGAEIAEGTRIGFYRQDFSTLNFEETVYQSLIGAIAERSDVTEHSIRSMAAGFLIGPEMMQTRVEHLSEGQKGLLSFARLILQRPGLLILDEPTNHINFRHLPIIAKALQMYGGAMILVSHMPEFIKEIKITQELDLGS